MCSDNDRTTAIDISRIYPTHPRIPYHICMVAVQVIRVSYLTRLYDDDNKDDVFDGVGHQEDDAYDDDAGS